MRDRLKEFMDKQGINAQELSERIGVQPSSVSHILTGRNKPSLDFLEKVLETFPDIDLKYLITGYKQVINKEIERNSELQIKAETPEEDRYKEDEKDPVVTNVTYGNEVVEIVKFFKNGTFKLYRQK